MGHKLHENADLDFRYDVMCVIMFHCFTCIKYKTGVSTFVDYDRCVSWSLNSAGTAGRHRFQT